MASELGELDLSSMLPRNSLLRLSAKREPKMDPLRDGVPARRSRGGCRPLVVLLLGVSRVCMACSPASTFDGDLALVGCLGGHGYSQHVVRHSRAVRLPPVPKLV